MYNVKMGKNTIKIIYILILTLFTVSSFSMLYFKNNARQDYIKKINYCFNITQNLEINVSCVEDLYEETLNDKNFINLYNYLQETATQEKSMRKFYICHKAAHNAGGMIVEKLGGITNSLKLLNKPACGLIHAPYDYFGREKHSFSKWSDLVKECSNIQSKLDYYIQCDDAIGHSIVQSLSKYKKLYNDPYFSYKVCAIFKDIYAQVNCGEAIIMERFGPLDPNVKPEAYIPVKDLVTQCLLIPSDIISGKAGCSSGVGWYLTMFYLDEVRLSSRNNDFSDILFKVEKDCAIFKSSLTKLCYDRFEKILYESNNTFKITK